MTAFQKQHGTVAQAPVDSDGGWGQVIKSIPSQGVEGLNVRQRRSWEEERISRACGREEQTAQQIRG